MIGGEFEIDLSRQKTFVPTPNTYYYASGRTALYQILRSMGTGIRALWMPDWLCHTMVEAVERAGVEVRFYELNEEFKPTVDALDRSGFHDGDAMLMINYFGLQDLADSARAVKEAYLKAVVIEDDVQAYWCFAEKENPYADYRFTSLRKAFAIPDGGIVKTNRKMPEANHPNTFTLKKIQAGVLKCHRGCKGVRDEDYLTLFKQGDALIKYNYDSQMSEESKGLFAGTDFERVKHQRQSNAEFLVENLVGMGIKPIMEITAGSVPLFVPIYLENRDEMRSRMSEYKVFCPVHWPLEGMPVRKGTEMAAHELSLIVDQRYNEGDMESIINVISSNKFA